MMVDEEEMEGWNRVLRLIELNLWQLPVMTMAMYISRHSSITN